MATSKLTIDLTERNRDILEQIKATQRSPYGNTINTLIEIFCNVPESVKKELIGFIKPQLKELYRQMDGAGDFNFGELSEKTQSYMDIATFLNDGKRISASEIDACNSMKKIPIKNGYLICPNDYIIVNPEQAEKCEYAGVVECRNSSKYGIPHLLFFCNHKYGREYDHYFEEHIMKLCCKAYPRFAEIMDMQVTPIDDPEHPGRQLNAKEWMEAPTIGMFAIYVQDDPTYGRNYEPPHGTRIIRTAPEEGSEF